MEKIYEHNRVEIYQLTPNLYFRKADLPLRGQCNGAYLVSGDIVGAVDVPTMEAAREMMEEARQLFGQPIRYIFLTHGHGDHVEGLPLFLDQEVTIFCSQRLMCRVSQDQSQHKAVFVGVQGCTQAHLAGLEVELFTLPDTAHSPWDMLIRLPREQCLCTGDVAVDFHALYFGDANIENWITSLRKLSEERGRYILPGHGEPCAYTKINEVAEFIEVLQRAARYCVQLLPKEVKAADDHTVNAIASGYLSGRDADALAICHKAGEDAQRELSTMIQHLMKE